MDSTRRRQASSGCCLPIAMAFAKIFGRSVMIQQQQQQPKHDIRVIPSIAAVPAPTDAAVSATVDPVSVDEMIRRHNEEEKNHVDAGVGLRDVAAPSEEIKDADDTIDETIPTKDALNDTAAAAAAAAMDVDIKEEEVRVVAAARDPPASSRIAEATKTSRVNLADAAPVPMPPVIKAIQLRGEMRSGGMIRAYPETDFGGFEPREVNFEYSWCRLKESTGELVTIEGQRAAEYTLVHADVGASIICSIVLETTREPRMRSPIKSMGRTEVIGY